MHICDLYIEEDKLWTSRYRIGQDSGKQAVLIFLSTWRGERVLCPWGKLSSLHRSHKQTELSQSLTQLCPCPMTYAYRERRACKLTQTARGGRRQKQPAPKRGTLPLAFCVVRSALCGTSHACHRPRCRSCTAVSPTLYCVEKNKSRKHSWKLLSETDVLRPLSPKSHVCLRRRTSQSTSQKRGKMDHYEVLWEAVSHSALILNSRSSKKVAS